MKKYLKVFIIFVFALIIFSCSKKVQANSINSISMDIFITDNGDASITEVWDCFPNSGTEVYHPYYNLGNSKIKDLTVSENSTYYTSLSSWDTSGSLQSKANKCGIHNIYDGIELCWGISSYSSHVYTAKYTITNFVSNLKDSQMIYWTLIPYDFSTTIENFSADIHANSLFTDNTTVFGYGCYGSNANVTNGIIHLDSKKFITSSQYITVLVKLPLKTFSSKNNLNNDFNFYYNMAQKGSTPYQKKPKFPFDIFIFSLVALVFFLYFLETFLKKRKQGTIIKFGSYGKWIAKEKVDYFREIPCDGNLYKAYYIALKYGLIKKKTDILGANLLKWLHEGRITIQTSPNLLNPEDKSICFIKDEDTSLTFSDFSELKLFNLLYLASDDGILEKNELKKWLSFNYTPLLRWFDDVIKQQENELINSGLLIHINDNRYSITPDFRNFALEIAGFKKFLGDYSLISSKEPIEVNVLENHLIYAQMLGIADKVANDFKDFYPNLIEQSHFSSYDNYSFINNSSDYIVSNARYYERFSSSPTLSDDNSSSGFSSGGGRRWFLWWRWWPEVVSVKQNFY